MVAAVDLGSGKPRNSRTHCPHSSRHVQPSTHTPMSATFSLWLEGRRQTDRSQLCPPSTVWIPPALSLLLACPSPHPHTKHQLNFASPFKVISLPLWLGWLHIPSNCHLTISQASFLWSRQLDRGSPSGGRMWPFPTASVSPFSCRVKKQPRDYRLPASLQ